MKRLNKRRVAILATDGFEQVELTVPLAAFKLAGAKVDVISLHGGKIRGMNLHLPGERIGVDHTIDKVSASDYDALFIPGGIINPDLLRQSAEVRDFVRAFHTADKPIASICHGPWVLVSAGVVEGRHLTSWPGLRDDIVNAGGIWRNASLVRDSKLVTSRGPQDLGEFVPAVIDLFAGKERALAAGFDGASDPAPDRPPGWAFVPMATMTVPRVLLFGAALLAGGIGVVQLRRALTD